MNGVICDRSRCTGCLTCVVSCLDHHYEAWEEDAVPMRLHRKEVLPSGLAQNFTDSCRHCGGAPCAAACPVQAIRVGEDGLVTVNQAVCIGCRKCAKACPFQIPRYNRAGKLVKCDRCAGKGMPACVRNCPRGALSLASDS